MCVYAKYCLQLNLEIGFNFTESKAHSLSTLTVVEQEIPLGHSLAASYYVLLTKRE